MTVKCVLLSFSKDFEFCKCLVFSESPIVFSPSTSTISVVSFLEKTMSSTKKILLKITHWL